MKGEIYINTEQLQDLLSALSNGGRWTCKLPPTTSSSTMFLDEEIVLDFCPETLYSDSITINLITMNSFPPPQTIEEHEDSCLAVRIQFTNQQRRKILEKYGKK